MRTRVKFDFSGLEEYMKAIRDAGGNVEEIVSEAIYESAKPVHADIEKWAEKHKRTGAALKGVDLSRPKSEGGLIYVDVGINSEKSPNAWHIAYVEYGTPRAKADPGIRDAFNRNKARVKKIQRDILKRGGLPID